MLKIKNYVKVQSLEEAYELNQKRTACVLGGMVWLKMGSSLHCALTGWNLTIPQVAKPLTLKSHPIMNYLDGADCIENRKHRNIKGAAAHR